MELTQIKQASLQVYTDCNVTAFPLSCVSILNHYGLKLYSYTELGFKNPELYQICRKYSKDAFLYGSVICYNDEMSMERTRFTLMHELGHFILHTDNETAANQFASHLLAPRCIVEKSKLTNADDVSALFGISRKAAFFALDDVKSKGFERIPIDEKILEHFYSHDLQIYVYHVSECPICGSNIYNSIKDTCLQCKKLSIKSR